MTVETIVTVAAVAGETAATSAPSSGEGLEAIATSLPGLALDRDIVQPSPQHDIDACIDAIALPDCPGQQRAAAGIAGTNKMSATTIVVASLVDRLFTKPTDS